MGKTQRVLLTLLMVGLAGTVPGIGAFAAFWSTTWNPGNTYQGFLDSTVRMYAAVSGTLAQYLSLTVTRGTATSPVFDSCIPATAFTADVTDYAAQGAGVVYSGLLSDFRTSYAAGIVEPTSGSPENWTTSENHVYKFVIMLPSSVSTNAQGQSATASFTGEARNQ